MTHPTNACQKNARISDLTRELRSIRTAYVSTAPPARRRQAPNDSNTARPLTNPEREAIDTQSKQLLRQLNAAITNLKQVEDVRKQTADSVALSKRAKGGLGALGRWAAGGAVTAKSPDEELDEAGRKTVAAVRESIILFLQQKLEEAGRVQSEMMEVRLNREVEKSKSTLYKAGGTLPGGIPYANDDGLVNGIPSSSPTSRNRKSTHGLPSDDRASTTNSQDPQLTPDQLQVFESENADLLRQYEDQLDQVRQAEKSILDISELHSTLHANLQQQSEHIEQLVMDSYLTTENLGKGNRELKTASERKSTAQAVFWGTVGFCGFLVVWDMIF